MRLEILEEIVHRAGKEMLVRVVSMLKLAQACEELGVDSATPPGTGTGTGEKYTDRP